MERSHASPSVAEVEYRFNPTPLLRNPHIQTLLPSLLRRPPPPDRERELIELEDGDFILCDWLRAERDTPQTPVAILLHGLAGNSESQYIIGMQQALHRRGWHSVAINFRGSTSAMNRRARCYHSGETGDLDQLQRHVRSRLPSAPLVAAGFSMGGNILLKWLGEQGAQADLRAACAISVPLLLDRCSTRMDQGISRLYRDHLVRHLKAMIRDKQSHFERTGNHRGLAEMSQLGDWENARSFWEFDEQVVAPLFGFASAQDYYDRSSSRQYLDKIRVPTLIINAEDDPFMTPDVIPHEHEISSCVDVVVTPHGGHVGFLEGPPWRPEYWLERIIPDYLERHLPD